MSGSSVLLDSVILIDHINALEPATQYLHETGEQAHISVITRAEVLSGAKPPKVPDIRALLHRLPLILINRDVADAAVVQGALRFSSSPASAGLILLA